MRVTRKKAAPGQLRMFYGVLPGDSAPDVLYMWGDGVDRCDGRLLHYIMTSKRNPLRIGEEWGPSFLEELDSRGYDISTLEFSIRKRSLPEHPR